MNEHFFREYLLAIIRGEEPPRREPCKGYANVCRCPVCKARASRKPGVCGCELKVPDEAGYCRTCRRAVPAFFEADAA